MSDYPAFGKIPRLNRPVIWTEKIDGTTAQVNVREFPLGTAVIYPEIEDWERETGVTVVIPPSQESEADGFPETELWISAGSRNRWLTRDDDNYGFAGWVHANAIDIGLTLGPGRHYGEWWGQGIQRKYGMDHKVFSLFNSTRWYHLHIDEVAQRIGLDVVPQLCSTTGFDETMALNILREWGSFAAPGFQNPEGVVGFHTMNNTMYKVLLEGDERPKGGS